MAKKQQFKAMDEDEELEKLLEARDAALNHVHGIVVSGDKKLTGLLSYDDIYQRMCNNIERLKLRTKASARVSGKIILEFEKPDETE